MVPLLPAMMSAAAAGGRPPQPATRIVCRRRIVLDGHAQLPQSLDHHPGVVAVQAPARIDSPSAKAAQTRARFVMLFDPGGRIEPRIGPAG